MFSRSKYTLEAGSKSINYRKPNRPKHIITESAVGYRLLDH